MKTLTWWQIELIPWYVFAAYWVITWLQVKRTKMMESPALRLATIVPIMLAFGLLFSTRLRIGVLGMRFLPDEDEIRWSGIALTWAGVVVAIWARYSLGQYWSARVTLKEGHRVVRSGPYAFVRHPIYNGDAAGGHGYDVGNRRVAGSSGCRCDMGGTLPQSVAGRSATDDRTRGRVCLLPAKHRLPVSAIPARLTPQFLQSAAACSRRRA